jgi:predicted GH43/DUF377 family glycosyl hydrolase
VTTARVNQARRESGVPGAVSDPAVTTSCVDAGPAGPSRGRRLAIAVLALAVSGCAAAPSAGSSAETPSSAPGQAPAFVWDGATPVVTRQLAGLPQESFINPGAVIEHDGSWHMFANVFTAWPGPVSVPHLTSTDGTTWKLAQRNPVLTVEDVPQADPGFDVSTGYVADDGTWVLILETVSRTDPWELLRATAPGPDGPWSVDPKPLLEPGSEGSLDAGGLAWPSVIRTEAGYFLYYTATATPRGAGVIAMATSSDGVTWHKQDRPVLVADQAWELGKLDRPRATVTDRGIAMVYSGGQLTDRGVAWSDDGQTWRKLGTAPAISAATFPVSGGSWDATLIVEGGKLAYYLEIGGGTVQTGTLVYRATADLS